MKIRSNHLETLRQEDLRRARQSSGTGMFDGMLATESAKSDSPDASQDSSQATAVATASPLPDIDVVGSATDAEAADANPLTERAVMEHLDSVLDQLESYASSLKDDSEQGALRNAYGVLEDISSQVGQLKQSLPELQQENPELQSVVDELEILTVTERFKFNRGDYI
ncbi:hypothetical protein [Megalodesulfovibrio paquesii]